MLLSESFDVVDTLAAVLEASWKEKMRVLFGFDEVPPQYSPVCQNVEPSGSNAVCE
jgi:hypothetical protein